MHVVCTVRTVMCCSILYHANPLAIVSCRYTSYTHSAINAVCALQCRLVCTPMTQYCMYVHTYVCVHGSTQAIHLVLSNYVCACFLLCTLSLLWHVDCSTVRLVGSPPALWLCPLKKQWTCPPHSSRYASWGRTTVRKWKGAMAIH